MSGVSESRFNMWRAVVALAHADHKITPDEEDFVERYLGSVPFSPEQKDILREDLRNAQDIAGRFNAITEAEDRAEFFEFARMLVWCDGDYDAQEEKIFEYLKETQLASVDQEGLRSLAAETRETARLQRLKEEAEIEQQADRTLGFGAIIKRWTGQA